MQLSGMRLSGLHCIFILMTEEIIVTLHETKQSVHIQKWSHKGESSVTATIFNLN